MLLLSELQKYYAISLQAVKTALNQIQHVPLQPIMERVTERWKNVEGLLLERFGKIPDLEGILYLIGINEVGVNPGGKFTKEQKQDLMHVAVCTLLEQEGYYEFTGRDGDGWPHYKALKAPPESGILLQELLLKQCVIEYFGQ